MVSQQPGSQPTRRALLRTGLAATAFGALGARSRAPVAARQPASGSVGDAAALKSTGSIRTPSPVATAPAWPIGQGANAARTRNMPGPGPQGPPKVLWTFPHPGANPAGAIADYPMVADGVLYVQSAIGGCLAIDTATGTELWRSLAGVGGGAIAGDGIILRSAASTIGAGFDLIRLSRTDGRVVWRAEQAKILFDWTPNIANGVGYMPSGSDLLAFDPVTGKPIWRAALQAPASRGAAVANGLAVIGDQQGLLYSISTTDGKIVWTHPTGAQTVGTPSIANGLAYVTIFGGPTSAYLALDLATGQERWHVVTDPSGNFYNGAINATMVYVTNTDGALYAFDARTGAHRWTFPTTGHDAKNASLIGDTVFIVSVDGFAIAVDATTGTERWRVPLHAGIDTPLVIVDGVVYAGTEAGEIYAIGGAGATTPAAHG